MLGRYAFDDNDDVFASPFFRGSSMMGFDNQVQSMFNNFNSRNLCGGADDSSSSYMSMSSYSTYSSSSNGGLPVVVSKSFHEVRKPGGIRETKESFQDSRIGKAGISVSRQIRDQGRTVAKIKDRDGTEQTIDTLHNIEENDTSSFDRLWERYNNNGGANKLLSDGKRHSSTHRKIEYSPAVTVKQDNDDNESLHVPRRRASFSGHKVKGNKLKK
jgi:hypothetical protein